VSQHFLDGAQVSPLFEHVRAEGVAQSVRMNIGGEALGNRDFLDDAAYAAGGETPSALIDQERGSVLPFF
jgi:hypothetical protein